jgi:hypothetical protein
MADERAGRYRDQEARLRLWAMPHAGPSVDRRRTPAEEFATVVMPRMQRYASQTYPQLIQARNGAGRGRANPLVDGRPNPLAVYLASINLSKGKTYGFELKGFARPKGADTKVVITEYELPRRTMQPHDVIVDEAGTIWSSNFGEKLAR